MFLTALFRTALFCAVLAALCTLPPAAATAAQNDASKQWGKLFVQTTPPDSTVRFMRIDYRYTPGMTLEKGTYLIEVSKPGYESMLKEVELEAGQENFVYVDLTNPGGQNSGQAAADDQRVDLEETITLEPPRDSAAEPSQKEEETGVASRSRMDEILGNSPRSRPSKKTEETAPAPAESEETPVDDTAPDLTYQTGDMPAQQPSPVDESFAGQIGPDGVTQRPEELAAPQEAVGEEDVQAVEEGKKLELPPMDGSEEPPSPEELMLVANHLTQAGDLPNAIRGFTLVLQQQPENVNAFVGRGFAYYKMGNYDFAVEDLTKAIELDELNLSAWFHRGNAQLMQGNADKALFNYDKALDLNNSVPDIYNARGTALYNRGDLAAAVQDFDVAASLDPEYVDAYFNRGSAYAKMGKHQLALDDFKKVLELDPADKQAKKRKKEMQKALRP